MGMSPNFDERQWTSGTLLPGAANSGQWPGRAVARFHLFSGSANGRHPDPTKEEREDVNYRVLPVTIRPESIVAMRYPTGYVAPREERCSKCVEQDLL